MEFECTRKTNAYRQFADIKANDDDTALCGQCNYYPNSTLCAYINVNCSRPGGENHKGTIDFWRRIKLAYNVTRDLYTNYGKEDQSVVQDS